MDIYILKVLYCVFPRFETSSSEHFTTGPAPMSFLKDLLLLLGGDTLGGYSDSFQSFSNQTRITNNEEMDGCRDESYALNLKVIAIAAILAAGVFGVAIPLVGKKRRLLSADSNLFVAAKAFAAGVILATGFVHMLPDATSALTDSCLQELPWSKFPFTGFIAMMAALATLLADSVGTQYYEGKQEKQSQKVKADSLEKDLGKVFGEEEGGAIHIVGMHAHHGHSHSQEEGASDEHSREHLDGYSHSHGIGIGDEEDGVRHIVVTQVLELGIVSHSVIIGLSLGVSHSPCTVRPLIGALSFHQFFEGFALGGCISRAKFKTIHMVIMACFFALTTPLGIGVGIALSSIYNANSPRALLIEGIFDSVSAGILVYLALVDLIAADFLCKRMSSNVRLQVVSYFALFLGAALMSSLAIWA